MSKHNGGPAFARPKSPKGEYTDSEVPCAQTGMSLRDYFAAKAMSAIVTSQLTDCGEIPHEEVPKFFAISADYAYVAADAMLAERAK